jgi:DMSO reductase anchor subunit
MRPDFSVLFLTTLIGAGQGLFLALVTVQLYALFDLLPPPAGHWFYAHGSLLALAFLLAGLIASFFHLGRPERAWRSAARWRTSWLSREVIMLPALTAVVFVYGVTHFFGFKPVLARLPSDIAIDLTVLLGIAGTVLAFALFLCTAMIYACLPFLREWASPLTVINYTLLGGASGFTLAAAFSAWPAPGLTRFFVGWAIVITLGACATRIASLIRNHRLKPRSTLQTAIGIKHPQIVQKAAGFLGGSFNTREFFHGRTPRFLRAIKWLFRLRRYSGPVAGSGPLDAQSERCLSRRSPSTRRPAGDGGSFAEANHLQNLYYQAIA